LGRPERRVADINAGGFVEKCEPGRQAAVAKVVAQGREQIPQEQRDDDQEDDLESDPQDANVTPEWWPLWCGAGGSPIRGVDVGSDGCLLSSPYRARRSACDGARTPMLTGTATVAVPVIVTAPQP
jgi:hypothetical protein